MDACLPRLSPATFEPHPLHGPDRCWTETNCYLDLWIELVHALGLPPEPMLGVAAAQDFEGDQFGFTKPSLDDIQALYGLKVQELAIYEPVEVQIARQLTRGRICLVEVDPFFLLDTGPAAYRRQRGKTTIAPNGLDLAGRRMEYFHNAGYFEVAGEDFEGLFRPAPEGYAPFRPYVEFTTLQPVRRDVGELRRLAAERFDRHWSRRPTANPIRAFQAALPEQVAVLAGQGEQAFHDFAFHNLRMLGANFELLGAGLAWLSEGGDARTALCQTIAETAKGAQFQLARAVARRRVDGFAQALDPAAAAWDALFDDAVVRNAA